MGIEATKKMGYYILVVITFILAVITIGGASYPNPENSTISLYIAIGIPVIIIINLIVAVYWVCRWRVWWIVPIIAILANWNFLTAMIQFNSADEIGHNLKVATYNVGSFNLEITGFTSKEISNFMSNEEKVDILCMQEYATNNIFNLDSLSNAFKDYSYQKVPKDEKGRTRLAIFSKYPIEKAYYIKFKETQNAAMYADIKVNNKFLRVFNLHLQTTSFNRNLSQQSKYNIDAETAIENIERSLIENSRIRAKQAEYIRTLIKKSPHPVVLCGDFNAIPSTYEYSIISDVLSDGFKECGNGYAYTFNHFLKMLRIDYIFHSDSIQGVKYYSTVKKWSDHNPVIMELNFGKN